MTRNCISSFLILLLISTGFYPAFSQSCSFLSNQISVNLSCGTNCGNIQVQVPDLRSTSDYTVNSIPYTPLSYITATPPLSVTCLSQDDKFFDTTFLPFSFCFYDSIYSALVVGTNGVVSFDVGNALLGNNWDLDPPLLIPNSGGGSAGTGNCATPSGTLYPRASIMAPYTDIYPLSSDPVYKIEARVEGTAPCRRFVICYYKVRLFSCPSNRVTSQIVLYENTGIIDVYIEDKPSCSFNGNIGIIGIQDWTRTKGIAAPGRNAGSWTAQNEAYRFTPSGGMSRFIQSQIFTLGGAYIATASVANTTPGLLDLNFPNICPSGNSEQYIIRTTYASCNDSNSTIEREDTVTVTRISHLNANVVVANIDCTNDKPGSITVDIPPGSGVVPYQFSVNAGPLQNGNIFAGLAAGNYSVYATDALGCDTTMDVTVGINGSLDLQVSTINTTCPGVDNGSISVNPQSGVAPFQYSLDGGPSQATGIFTNLAAGGYTLTVTDVSGCGQSQNIIITSGTGLTAGINTTPTSCTGANNGTISVSPSNGDPPYQYALDGNPSQPSNLFTGLAAGNYSITVTDKNGCRETFNAVIDPGAPLTATINKNDLLCYADNTGIIVVNVTNGSSPYLYSLDNVNWQSQNSFNDLAAGNYTIYYSDNNNCSGSQQVSLSQPAPLDMSLAVTPVSCNGSGDGKIKISVTGGISPYWYSMDGVSYQYVDSFSVSAGNYTIYAKDANGCIRSQPVLVTAPSLLTMNQTIQDASCDGGADGMILVNAAGGNGGFSYSLDNVNFQTSPVFNVLPGNYTVYMKDEKGCVLSETVLVGINSNLQLSPSPDETICEGTSVQLDLSTNASQFSWTPASALNNPAVRNPVASPVITTQYIVTATLGFCSEKDTILVYVNPAPVPDAGPDGDICYGQSFTLQGGGGSLYLWSPSKSLSSATIPNPVSTPNETINYSLSVTDSKGCVSLVSDQVSIKVTPPIVVQTFPSDTVVFAGDQFQLLATSAATDYIWDPPWGLDNAGVPDPLLTVSSDMTFTVTASTSAGCKGEAEVTIKVYKGPELYVPTGFTPNGDGKNDLLRPFPVGITKLNYFRVYNRWGQLLYSTTILREGWDGRYGGIDQPLGTYVWMAEGETRDGRRISKKGTVTLIR